MKNTLTVVHKRIYDEVSADDGQRILVDRLWPRGVKKETAKIDVWAKELTPSTDLRQWFHEDTDSRYQTFTKRYVDELKDKADAVATIVDHRHHTITLLTAAKDIEHSHIPTLQKFITDNA